MLQSMLLIGLLLWTPAKVQAAANIVAGEATYNCSEGMLVVACTLVRDVETQGFEVLHVCPTCRWHGYRRVTNNHAAYTAVELALAGGCQNVPRCDFLGNTHDRFAFRRWGATHEIPLCGHTMVCSMRQPPVNTLRIKDCTINVSY
jgi:hypothetical protein